MGDRIFQASINDEIKAWTGMGSVPGRYCATGPQPGSAMALYQSHPTYPTPMPMKRGTKKPLPSPKEEGGGGVGGGGVLLNFTILLGKKNRSYGVSDLVGTNHRSIRIYFRASSTHRNNENRINVMVWDILRGGSRPVQRAAP